MTTTHKPRRRWLRFSIRSLLLLVAVIAVSLGWALHKAREQGIAVAALREMGCMVGYDNPDPSRSPTVLERLRKLLGEKESKSVTWVNGNRSQITDDGLEHLEGLARLRLLDLIGTPVTDAGLVHLGRLSQLLELDLGSTQVTDAGLENLRRLTQLQSLDLHQTKVTDAGMALLRGMTQLQVLDLEGTQQITDVGLAHLGGLTQLDELHLGGTQVTDAGIRRLQKALPNCQIEGYNNR